MKQRPHFPHRPSRHIIRFLAMYTLVSPFTAQAQTPVNAGSLLQQIEQERDKTLPKSTTPKVAPALQPMKPLAGTTVTVKTFQFAGNTLLSNEQLSPVVAEYLDRPISFAELQKAAAAVAEAYRVAGWVVRAYLPQQDIQNGVVTIQIVEAVFGGIKLEGAMAKRIQFAQIQHGFEAQQTQGALLNLNALDRALLLMDDLPGVAVSGSLQEGAKTGETDLVLKLIDEPLITGDAGIDNTGSRSTDSKRATANININSPLGLGDLLSTNLIYSQGTEYLRLGMTVPVGNDGWRVGVNTSYLNYKLVTSEFNALQGKGCSGNTGLEASYPIIRSRLKNLYFNLNYDHKEFNNLSGSAIESRYKTDSYSLALNGNLFDNLGGGGANSISLGWTGGRVGLGNLDAGENTALDGHYSKLRYSLSRQQVITSNLSLYAAVYGQDSHRKDLDSSEKLYLGGANGVRAYPSSEGGGSTGNLANIELRWRLPNGYNVATFYDNGGIKNVDGSPSYRLKGAGLTVGWQAKFGLNVKATWARRIGDNPNPTANGNDQDGSLTKNRFWLMASQSF